MDAMLAGVGHGRVSAILHVIHTMNTEMLLQDIVDTAISNVLRDAQDHLMD